MNVYRWWVQLEFFASPTRMTPGWQRLGSSLALLLSRNLHNVYNVTFQWLNSARSQGDSRAERGKDYSGGFGCCTSLTAAYMSYLQAYWKDSKAQKDTHKKKRAVEVRSVSLFFSRRVPWPWLHWHQGRPTHIRQNYSANRVTPFIYSSLLVPFLLIGTGVFLFCSIINLSSLFTLGCTQVLQPSSMFPRSPRCGE